MDRDFRLVFDNDCGSVYDFEDMDLENYTKKELQNMDSQMNNAKLDISRELRQRGSK